ncbi:acyl-CoA thioesterase [bacterium]|nr:acyl-CoA thioesterase [bacterium]
MSLYKSEYEVKVSFEDLDPMNVVWHGNYMRYMEQARCDMLDKLRYTYMDMKADGYAYPVAKMQVKYIKPAEFGDILIIKSEVITVEPSLNIKYTIFNKKNRVKIFEASTMQIGVNINTRESVYTPPKRLIQAIKEERSEKD